MAAVPPRHSAASNTRHSVPLRRPVAVIFKRSLDAQAGTCR